ncbi:uncharacterized protein LOC106668712 isoform X2 [Cimex lectularius]|uniref:Uncharacterized protein n=1 Tax=Cimex lectularius TaxID=79782 RepID=A0A8I6TID3_CIMLE|nr:uncharacterized protein LOC106668712 isoform X2 [Cimex lectularius]
MSPWYRTLGAQRICERNKTPKDTAILTAKTAAHVAGRHREVLQGTKHGISDGMCCKCSPYYVGKYGHQEPRFVKYIRCHEKRKDHFKLDAVTQNLILR